MLLSQHGAYDKHYNYYRRTVKLDEVPRGLHIFFTN